MEKKREKEENGKVLANQNTDQSIEIHKSAENKDKRPPLDPEV